MSDSLKRKRTDDPYRDHLARDVDWKRRRLRDQAEQMGKWLTLMARRLDSQDDPPVSELGELQGRGPMFDVACASYAHARQTLKDYDAFRSEAVS